VRSIWPIECDGVIVFGLPVKMLRDKAWAVSGCTLAPGRIVQNTQDIVRYLRSGSSRGEQTGQPVANSFPMSPTLGVTTGMPAACASTSVFGVPSNFEVIRKTSMHA
jgi:hypothetical protein